VLNITNAEEGNRFRNSKQYIMQVFVALFHSENTSFILHKQQARHSHSNKNNKKWHCFLAFVIYHPGIPILQSTCIGLQRIRLSYRTAKSRGSSVSIVSVYGLNDRAIEVRSRQRQADFSSNLYVQTGSGAHPASCPMGTGVPFPEGKARPGRESDHSPPSSAEVVNE
jgi:hypothetical protein